MEDRRAGVVGAAAVGLLAGSLLQPALATPNDGPIGSLGASVADSGPADLTPPYVSPQSLSAWRVADAAPSAPDPIEREVSRDLARANAELRASEAALEQYHRATLLVRSAADVADQLGTALSSDPMATDGAHGPERLAPAPALAVGSDARPTRY